MKQKKRIRGFMLVELLIVIALLAALISIAVPRYVAYTEIARTAACLSNRHNIEQDKRTSYLNNDVPSLVIDNRYKCPSGGVYVWLVSDTADPNYPRIGCSLHYGSVPEQGKKDYVILLNSNALNNTIKEVFISFTDYVSDWILKEKKMPVVNYTNGSSSWNSALYTGTDKTNLFQARFWNEYFQFVDEKDFNAANNQISDFKVFFKRDGNGNTTSDIAGVYLQIGGNSRIYFSNGTMIVNKHYSNYVNTKIREFRPPQ
jgi:type II secretory pathway pseudopilin PulG